MKIEPEILDIIFTSLRGLLLLIAFPLLVLWLGWMVVQMCIGYISLWQMRSELGVSVVPYLPLALIAACSGGFAITQVSLESWNRLSRHIYK